MNTELLRASAQSNETSVLAERQVLAAAAYSPSVLGKLEADLRAKGSLLEASATSAEEAAMLAKRLGVFAAERVVGFSPQLAGNLTDETVFVGGVCALSTRESTLLGRGQTEDPVSGKVRKVDSDELGFSDAITAVQVFETIGLTAGSSAVVLEDTLWSDRVIEKLRNNIAVDDDSAEAARQVVGSRNQRSFRALQRLRGYLFDSPSDLAVVRDTAVIDELNSRTDEMLAKLGLPPPPDANDYRFVYAGMYSYVWREIMAGQGVVNDNQLMVIYEPWKHFAPEDNETDTISTFRQRLLQEAPFMQAGSASEQVGLIAYIEPRDSNGRILRKSVPTALVPNSENYSTFDFGRFPIVPKKANALPNASEFQFVDELDNLTLSKNPAFLWGLAYPPTAKTCDIMQSMVALSSEAKSKAKTVFQENIALSAKEKQELSLQLRGTFSREMGELSDRLVGELQSMTNVLFGEDDEAK